MESKAYVCMSLPSSVALISATIAWMCQNSRVALCASICLCLCCLHMMSPYILLIWCMIWYYWCDRIMLQNSTFVFCKEDVTRVKVFWDTRQHHDVYGVIYYRNSCGEYIASCICRRSKAIESLSLTINLIIHPNNTKGDTMGRAMLLYGDKVLAAWILKLARG